ncbi:MAG: LysR substrate-binding domain-containing protein, partial [Pseudomonadota bacterium]
MSTNNIVSIIRAVRLGAGAAVMPKWFVAQALNTSELVDVLPEWRAKELPINVAFLPARHQPKRLDVFLEWLRADIAEMPGLNRGS